VAFLAILSSVRIPLMIVLLLVAVPLREAKA